MARYECNVCGWIYDETVGDPEHGLPAGTRWEDVPEDWSCPDCGVTKDDFTLIDDGAAAAARSPQADPVKASPAV